MPRKPLVPELEPCRWGPVLAGLFLLTACDRGPDPARQRALAWPVEPGVEAVIHPIPSGLLSSSRQVPVRDISVARAGRSMPAGLASLQHFDSTTAVGLVGSPTAADGAVYGRLIGAVVQSDGDILLLDQDYYTVAILNADLEPRGSFGRVGDGPGEFLMPRTLVPMRDDRVAVLDRRRTEIQVFVKRDGNFVLEESTRISSEPIPNPVDVCIVDGRTFLMGLVVSLGGRVMRPGELIGVDPNEVSLARGFIHEVDGRGNVLNSFSFPYAGMEDNFVASDLAYARLACDRERLWAAYVTLGEVHAYSLGGDPLWITRITDFDHPGTVHTRSSAGERLRSGLNVDYERGGFSHDLLQEMKLISPRTLAVHVQTLHVGSVEQGFPTSHTHRTYLLDAETGQPRGAFEAPHRVLGGGHGKAVLYREEPHPEISVVSIAD